jgi:hypothetical protein
MYQINQTFTATSQRSCVLSRNTCKQCINNKGIKIIVTEKLNIKQHKLKTCKIEHPLTSKRLVVMAELIMLVLIITYAELKDHPSPLHRPPRLQPFLSSAKDPKASLIKSGICCATKCAAWNYYNGIGLRVYFGYVKNCCNQLCVLGKWLWLKKKKQKQKKKISIYSIYGFFFLKKNYRTLMGILMWQIWKKWNVSWKSTTTISNFSRLRLFYHMRKHVLHVYVLRIKERQ